MCSCCEPVVLLVDNEAPSQRTKGFLPLRRASLCPEQSKVSLADKACTAEEMCVLVIL